MLCTTKIPRSKQTKLNRILIAVSTKLAVFTEEYESKPNNSKSNKSKLDTNDVELIINKKLIDELSDIANEGYYNKSDLISKLEIANYVKKMFNTIDSEDDDTETDEYSDDDTETETEEDSEAL